MTNLQNLLKQADIAFDDMHFNDAINLYKHILSIEYNHVAFTNLRLAEDMWRLQYIKSVAKENPESVSAHLDRIFTESTVGSTEKAIIYATEYMDDADLTYIQKHRVASLRFRAAIRAGISDYLFEDFTTIWKSISVTTARQHMLEVLLSATKPDFAPIFEQLATDGLFSSSVQKVLKIKAKLLKQSHKIERSHLEDI